jgi:hypothetical protein
MKALPKSEKPLNLMVDSKLFQGAELDQWGTDPFEIKPNSIYYFAFELKLQDESTKYFYAPDKKIGEQFIQGQIKAENLQTIFIY